MYAAIDLAVDKLEDQIRRQKTRLSRKHKEHLSKAFLEESEMTESETEAVPVKTKTIHAGVMSLDDAIMQMELSDHTFYIYTDEETEKTAVVYLRKDGSYGLIETE